MCLLCDTLRNDNDDGDECVECGASYPDARKPVKWEPPAVLVAAVRTHAQKSRGVTTRHINGLGGLTLSRRAR